MTKLCISLNICNNIVDFFLYSDLIKYFINNNIATHIN